MTGRKSPAPSAPGWTSSERRKNARYVSDTVVTVVLPQRGVRIPGRFLDLSEGGCRVEPLEPFLLWSDVLVEIHLEAPDLRFRLEGVTRGSRGGYSFGVQFNKVSREILARLHSLLPAATGAAAPAEGPSDEAGWDSDDEAPVVRNLGPPGGKERRRHARYTVDTRGTLFEALTGQSKTGTLVEISHTGCRFHLSRPFVREIGTPVELTLELKGVTIRMAGETRVQVSQRTVGIMFHNMTPRREAILEDLISEIRTGGQRPGSSGGVSAAAASRREGICEH